MTLRWCSGFVTGKCESRFVIPTLKNVMEIKTGMFKHLRDVLSVSKETAKKKNLINLIYIN